MSTPTITHTYLDGADRDRRIYRTANGHVERSVRIGPAGEAHATADGRIIDSVVVNGVVKAWDKTVISSSVRVDEGATLITSGRAYAAGSTHVQAGYVQLADDVSTYNNTRLRGLPDRDLALTGAARLTWNADVCHERHVLVVGPVGSEGRTVTVYRAYMGGRWTAVIAAGCFTGTLDALKARMDAGEAWYATDQTRKPWETDYKGIIAMGRARQREWRAAGKPTAEDRDYWASRSGDDYIRQT